MDQGDPTVTTLLGDTPGTLGWLDAGDWTMRSCGASAPGTVSVAADGTPIAVGSDKTMPATKEAKVWGAWTPPAGDATLYKLLKDNDAEIQTAYAAVVAATPDKTKFPHGKKATSYETTTKLEMTPTDIGERWLADVKAFQAQLPHWFSGFASYPADARQSLTDIAYQYGAKGASQADSGKLKKAAEKGDWSAAADCTDDLEGNDDRNAVRKTLFQAAAKAAPLKVEPKK